MKFPNKKYRIIYADPPWNFSSQQCSKPWEGIQTALPYKTMSKQELLVLPVSDISLLNSVLFMWTTDAHLEFAMEVIRAWGFTYKTIGFVWHKKTVTNKDAFIMGNWTNKSSEICLLAIKGRPHAFLLNHRIRQFVEAQRKRHSAKPDEVRNRINKMFGSVSKIELFAREQHDGWDSWGDEIC